MATELIPPCVSVQLEAESPWRRLDGEPINVLTGWCIFPAQTDASALTIFQVLP